MDPAFDKRKIRPPHGQKGTRIYNIWRTMRKRCFKPDHDSYRYYGAKGIIVCDEWLMFIPFYKWAIANGYNDDLTIDRLDDNGNYEPSNCQWLSMWEQNRKHKHCILITHQGRTQLAIDWAREFGVKLPTFYWRYHRGYSMDKILGISPIVREDWSSVRV